MSTVFFGKRSRIALRGLGALAVAVLVLQITVPAAPSIADATKPTVKPVVAPSESVPGDRLKPFLQPHPQQILRDTTIAEPIPSEANGDAKTQSDGNTEITTPDDTFARQQWSLQHNPSIAGATGLFGSQEYLTSARQVIVAVVDSGVILQHEDLTFLPGYDFIHDPIVGNDGDGRDHDPSDPGDWVSQEDIDQQTVSEGCPIATSKWHGTAISGLIGATAYNATGIAGGSPSVSMLPVRVTGKCGGYVSDLIDGIRWAAGLEVNGVANNQNPADVINLSVGFPGACSNAMQQAINDATNAGAMLVTAATNSAADLDSDPYSPASCDNVFTVAATDRAGAITSYTALGQSVFLSAPGGTVSDGIITTQNDGHDAPVQKSSYGFHYGTSIAAAHVSSTIANLLAYQPDLTRSQIEQLLSVSATSTDYDPLCRSGQCGQGRLNAFAAMELLATNYLLANDPTVEDSDIPVQLAASGVSPSSRDAVVTTAADKEDIWAGAADWYIFASLMLLIGVRMRAR